MDASRLTALGAACLLLLIACRKDREVIPPGSGVPDLAAASDQAMAMDYFNDMLVQVDAAASANGLRDMNDACAPVVSFDTLAMPHTMTVDFGAINCTALNGRTRRGVLHVSFTGPYREQGTVITITPQDYYVDDHLVEGSKTVTNMGLNSDGDPYFNVVVDGSITAADGSWTATHHAERVRTWTEGSPTMDLFDDVYLITGGGYGVNHNGLPYTTGITNALRAAMSCPFITQGTLTITPEGLPERTVDFGDGTCDGTITITVNGYTFTITMG